jgi:hypothetical protein
MIVVVIGSVDPGAKSAQVKVLAVGGPMKKPPIYLGSYLSLDATFCTFQLTPSRGTAAGCLHSRRCRFTLLIAVPTGHQLQIRHCLSCLCSSWFGAGPFPGSRSFPRNGGRFPPKRVYLYQYLA